jgi:APA family basic amino acid/polyamine antiporter
MTLQRELGLFGATMMGLGSIIGTGVFVSIGIATGIAGSAVIVAIAMAALVAACNGFSSAQLAANHPVSGGTYEYGYRYLSPTLGFAAGWMFLCAKTASAAAAAIGFAGYLLNITVQDSRWLAPVAAGTACVMTAVVLAGIRLSNQVNIAIVSITLVSLACFIAAGASQVSTSRLSMQLEPLPLLHSCALMFVAFTGYGRIATLGEEVIEPHRTIPKAIVTTLLISMLLYIGVAIVAVGGFGADRVEAATLEDAAPLVVLSRSFSSGVPWLVSLGAMTAMLGVLLNLLLGLSRVLLAMGRRGDMPRITSNLTVSVVMVGGIIAILSATGSVKTTWTFSAFTVLVYYAITNAAALRLGAEERLFARVWAWIGLIACLALAFAIDWPVWTTGLGILAIGLVWHWLQAGKDQPQNA